MKAPSKGPPQMISLILVSSSYQKNTTTTTKHHVLLNIFSTAAGACLMPLKFLGWKSVLESYSDFAIFALLTNLQVEHIIESKKALLTV